MRWARRSAAVLSRVAKCGHRMPAIQANTVASAPQALAPIRNWSAMASMLRDSLHYAAFVKSRRGSHGAEHGNRKGRGIASRRDGGLFKRSTALFERAPARPLPYRSRSENRTHQPASDSSADPTRPAASSRSARPLLARAKLIACNWKRDGLRSSPPRQVAPARRPFDAECDDRMLTELHGLELRVPGAE